MSSSMARVGASAMVQSRGVHPTVQTTAPNSAFHAARRSAPLAARVVKGADCEGRGNPYAVLRSAPGLRERTER